MTVEQICKLFNINSDNLTVVQLKSGNINSTYKVTADGTDYIVQKINGYVFKNPEQIMSNIALVTTHISNKLRNAGQDDERKVLHFLNTSEGKNFTYDEDKNVWRIYRFVPNSVAFDSTDDLKILKNVGSAFGQFQRNLLDFDASQLYETIVDFHNTPKRLENLFKDIELDSYSRVAESAELIEYIKAKRELAEQPVKQVESGIIPLRVTHNDTKCNNVLFDCDTGEELAVIDLDTIMPGIMAYDFGDAVRFAACSTAEDEPDISKVYFDLTKFKAFAEGFIQNLNDVMTVEELDSMAIGTFAITIELASRFLDDYLTGDKYFAVKRPRHNFERARCQIALAKDIERKLEAMKEILHSI